MKNSAFIFFLIIALSVHGLINFYIFNRGWQATPWMGAYRYLALAIFLILALAYPVGRFAERLYRCDFTELLIHAGSFYLAVMVYLFLLILVIDLLRLGNHIFHYFPAVMDSYSQTVSKVTLGAVVILVLAAVTVGCINAMHPRIQNLNLTIQKACRGLETLTIVMASDLHLGRNVSIAWLERMVDRINDLEPDLVLLPGDIMDEDVNALTQQDVAQALQSIRARFGVFAVTGNHEYFRDVEETVAYLRQGNVRVLQDEAVKIGNSFYIVGRNDLMAVHFGDKRRPLDKLLKGIDRSAPIILMDHQPVRLKQAQENGVDLQLSGHTHHGQLFPFHWITEAVYEVSWGYLQKGDTHYYVSCGLGTWGPPVRLGSVPEIVKITVTFEPTSPVQLDRIF